MKTQVILFHLLAVTCCGKFTKQPEEQQPLFIKVDAKLQPYLDEYLADKGEPLSQPIGMGFMDLPYVDETKQGKYVGFCISYDNGKKEIHIDKEFWYNASEEFRQWVVWHELGHCDLDLDHDERLDERGFPLSIMFPRAFNWGEWGNEYKERLFER